MALHVLSSLLVLAEILATVQAECEHAGSCAGSRKLEPELAMAFDSEDEAEDQSLQLLQRRQRQMAREARETELKATGVSPSFADILATPDSDNFATNFGINSNPSPITAISIGRRRRASEGQPHSLNLRFNAVKASCGSRLANAARAERCSRVVQKSAMQVFVQLHIRNRIAGKVAPLTKEETKQFKVRFQELVIGDSKSALSKPGTSQQYKGWKMLVTNGYDTSSPVLPKALVQYVNSRSKLGWQAKYDNAFANVSKAVGMQKLGFTLSREDAELLRKGSTEVELLELSEERQRLLDSNSTVFDAREHWPHCKKVLSHVRYQTCSNCWSHVAALIAESRLCIQSEAKFSGVNAWLSQSYIAACRTDGMDYCSSGGGLLAFSTVSRWGVPTGGPNYRGNIESGVETCYPQVLPHERGLRCPGKCSPYSRYPRPLTEDLFYLEYKPRGLTAKPPSNLYLAKRAMVEEGPILIAMRLYQDLYAYEGGIYKLCKKRWNRLMGGHAVTGMGFGPGYLLAVNSWSEEWGLAGSFKMEPSPDVIIGYFLPGHSGEPRGAILSSQPLPTAHVRRRRSMSIPNLR